METTKESLQLQTLLQKADQSVMYVTNRPRVVFEKGDGCYLLDTEGNRYLDMIAGWAVCSLGHSSPVIIDAITNQAKLLINPSPAFYNQPMIEFAHLLTQISCLDKAFFINSGAEANEGAVKLARKYGQLYKNGAFEIITMWNSFHGRTLAMMAASGKKKWEGLYEPKPKGFTRVPINDIQALKQTISKDTCAIMLEPIQGEGGVIAADKTYFKQVRELCDENNILLIVDEVQTGLGRLGYMFAYEYFGIEPDIMTLAKGIGGGFPLSALLAKDRVCCFEAGDQGGTYCGTPLATAVGKAIIEEIIKTDLCGHVRKVGQYFTDELNQRKSRYPFITEVRGMGLLLAIGFDREIANQIKDQCFDNYLLVNAPNSSCIRFMPPLNLTMAQVNEALNTFDKVLQTIKK
jgi:acetylornithine/N-succinyldiaminopimelate aminotransferase